MEAQAVRRRINTISAHFAPTDELSATHVLPMNCSSTLNSVIRRYDNKMYFARQGSAFQASFMRQGSNEDVLETGNTDSYNTLNSMTTGRRDSKMYFARQGSSHQACFMRQAGTEEVLPDQSGTPLKYCSCGNEFSYFVSQEEPLFSRPSSTGKNFSTAGVIQPAFQSYALSAADPPKFAMPSGRIGQQKETYTKEETYSSTSNVIEWSPKLDIAESGRTYVITVEIPGVSVKDIRVEVDDKKLTVAGKRSTQYLKVAGCTNDSISAYLRREIVQGPYEVVWPLPANVNKDSVSAEFLDGFLRVVIPKL
ncbi:hypothetical protein L484_020098 [Morus notabilis]|uniref:SHSP domain-containing protein n=1 Tax=Morus notabilis TaxID=981085 RepID=W9RLQ2_9ROSA|nr:uncharacterized protein LOC21403007 [Morus notabilis]EXB80840.1 hypothetical protein L484_020098 [Morus notabilis]